MGPICPVGTGDVEADEPAVEYPCVKEQLSSVSKDTKVADAAPVGSVKECLHYRHVSCFAHTSARMTMHLVQQHGKKPRQQDSTTSLSDYHI